MTNTANVRSYCNPWPRYSAEAQAALLTGEVYTENRTGKIVDALIRSLRPGDVVEVVHLGLLAPATAKTLQKRRTLEKRIEAILAKGASIREVSSGQDSAAGQLGGMSIRASEFIGNAGRVAAKRQGRGKPPIELTDGERTTARLIWTSQLYTNSKDRRAAIHEQIGRKLGHGWCYTHFGPPSGQTEKN